MNHRLLIAQGLVLMMGCFAAVDTMAEDQNLLLDDFSTRDGVSSFGTQWVGFTDRVMGGRSDLNVSYIDTDVGPAVQMTGRVRLENNGGFIQIRLPLQDRKGPADISGYTAIRLEVQGQPGAYYLHLRTRDNRRPWHYYSAPVPVTDQWQTLDIPINDFQAQGTRAALDLSQAESIAVVAYGEAFDADIQVRRIELIAP